MIKALTIACAAVGVFAAGQAFADTTAPAQGTTQAPIAATAAPDAQVSMVADSGVTQPETRAQVYRDLVHAQRDGELKHLDSTIYAHH
jgi:long-subunit fatty acid transport protein